VVGPVVRLDDRPHPRSSAVAAWFTPLATTPWGSPSFGVTRRIRRVSEASATATSDRLARTWFDVAPMLPYPADAELLGPRARQPSADGGSTGGHRAVGDRPPVGLTQHLLIWQGEPVLPTGMHSSASRGSSKFLGILTPLMYSLAARSRSGWQADAEVRCAGTGRPRPLGGEHLAGGHRRGSPRATMAADGAA
jgi:hypothetical protein